ncbi:MAG: hypothetical protein PHF05_08930 [Candidatus Izemoplasmatales bacterium]|jgi:hypothetical protein|nr:hypothetical protein [Candidatus Izemoplasmatales bacterium]
MKKVMFSINVTDDKKNIQTDEIPLITKRLEQWQKDELERVRENAEEFKQKVSMPMAFNIVKIILSILTLIIVVSLISSFSNGTTFKEAYENAPVVFYLLPVSALGWVGIILYGKKREKAVLKTDETEKMERLVNETVKRSREEFGIPEDVLEMDILAFKYKLKDDEIKVVSTGMISFVNLSMDVFVNENKLLMANIEQLVEVDLNDFVSIVRIDKIALIPQWNKNIPNNEEPYKKFKLKVNQFQQIFVKPYYIVKFNIGDDEYNLYVPVYEISRFIKLTGIDYNDEFIE